MKQTSNMAEIKKKLDKIYYTLISICLVLGGVVGIMLTLVTK